MKLNSTIALTFVLLASMVAAGVISAASGLVLGREALKGVTQPDTRPTKNLANSRKAAAQRASLVILREEDVIATAKARMGGKAESRSNSKAPDSEAKDNKSENKAAAANTTKLGQLPLSAQSQGVKLEISSVQQQGDNLILNVSLQNTGNQAARFLYSFLNLTDDQGRTLSASTEGLPADLPPDSEAFSGTISIPSSTLNNAKALSLNLTDYPDQKLQLKLSNIPIAR